MRAPGWLWAAAACCTIAASACLSFPQDGRYACSPAGEDCGATDDAGEPAGPIHIRRPATTVYVRDHVLIEVSVDDPSLKVELTANGLVLATLATPFQYDWDVSSTPEATYTLVASTTLNGKAVQSPPRQVVVDRTAPTVSTRVPSSDSKEVSVREPVQVVFSEPVSAASVMLPGAVALKGASAGTVFSLELSPSGTTLGLRFTTAPAVPATLTFSYADLITDLAGNPLVPASHDLTFPEWVDAFPAYSASAMGVDGGAVQFGGVAFQPGGTEPSVSWAVVARDPTGGPATTGPAQSYVAHYSADGGGWGLLGGSVSSYEPSPFLPGQQFPFTPRLDVDAQGRLVAAVNSGRVDAGVAGYGMEVRRWNGGSWELVAPLLSNVNQPAFALRGNDAVVALPSTDGVRVLQSSATSWNQLGAELSGNSGASTYGAMAQLYVDPTQKVSVIWAEEDTSTTSRYELFVRTWDGTTWGGAPGTLRTNSSTSAYWVQAPTLFQYAGKLYAGWGDGPNPYDGYVSAQNNVWASVAAPLSVYSASGTDVSRLLFVNDGSSLVVALAEQSGTTEPWVHLRRLSGNSWVPLTATAPAPANAPTAYLAAATTQSRGAVLVALTSGNTVYFRRLNR